jgi:hypothetical protein
MKRAAIALAMLIVALLRQAAADTGLPMDKACLSGRSRCWC